LATFITIRQTLGGRGTLTPGRIGPFGPLKGAPRKSPGEPEREQGDHRDRPDGAFQAVELGVAVIVGERRPLVGGKSLVECGLLDVPDGHTTGMPFSAISATAARTGGGTAGFCSRREMSPLVKAAMSTEPISAVPSEAPRFWAVPWRPPASLVFAGSTDDMMTFPSWGEEQAGPDAEDGERDSESRFR
jgi:hypothetical protein